MRFILLLAKRVGPAAILLLAACPLWAESGDASADTYVPGTIDSLSWRNIGPNRGGRSIAVSGNPNRPFEYLCLLFIHPRAPNLINLRSASTMPA